MTTVGKIHVFHGDGRGKTSAAMGEVLRAKALGQRVGVVFFMKGKRKGAEYRSLENLGVEYAVFGRSGFLSGADAETQDKVLARQALEYSGAILKSGRFDLVILDEIINAQYYGLILADDIVKLMVSKPNGMSMILTGKTADKRILERADQVCVFHKIKHPYDKGIFARKGIDF